jgi:hypothetical protein
MFRNHKIFHTAAIISFIIAVIIFIISNAEGKAALFLALNNDLGSIADYYFKFMTYLGDGALWILVVVFLWRYKKHYLKLSVLIFILSTVFTQVFKYFIIPDEPRPTKAITGNFDIHVVPDVDLHTVSSFPGTVRWVSGSNQ